MVCAKCTISCQSIFKRSEILPVPCKYTVSIQETRPTVNITCSQKSAVYNVMAYSVFCCYLANSGFKEYKYIYTYVYINASDYFTAVSAQRKGKCFFLSYISSDHIFTNCSY